MCDVERESETLRPPPSLNAICRGGSPLPSPPAPGAYAPLAGAGCGAPRSLGRSAHRLRGLGRYPVCVVVW